MKFLEISRVIVGSKRDGVGALMVYWQTGMKNENCEVRLTWVVSKTWLL